MRQPLLLAAGLGLALTGCQLVKQESPQQAAQQVCDHLGAVSTALAETSALQPSSTVGQAQAAAKDLKQALKALEASENTLEKVRLKAFDAQVKAFRQEVKAIRKDKSLTLEAAAATLKAKAQPVIAAHQALQASVNCPVPAAAKP